LNLQTIVVVASGGAFGAISRYAIIDFSNRYLDNKIPFGTLYVNLIGSLFIGILFAYLHNSDSISNNIKLFMATGFLGALTTYSTFALESFLLVNDKYYIEALINIVLNLFGTIILVAIGYSITTNLIK